MQPCCIRRPRYQEWCVALVVTVVALISGCGSVSASDRSPSTGERSRKPWRRVSPVPEVRCDPSIGVVSPLETCSADWPCTDLLATYALLDPPVDVIDVPTDVPVCATGERGTERGRPLYDDGAPKTWNPRRGITRYRCEAQPEGDVPEEGWPLIVWLPGSGGNAASVYDTTSLRGKNSSFDLIGEGDRAEIGRAHV